MSCSWAETESDSHSTGQRKSAYYSDRLLGCGLREERSLQSAGTGLRFTVKLFYTYQTLFRPRST